MFHKIYRGYFEGLKFSLKDRGIFKNLDVVKLLSGKQICYLFRQFPPKSFREAEFKVFSQYGEDGLIQYVLSKIPSIVRRFIEFGVEDYWESNTRFLLCNDNWQGLIFDGNEKYMNRVRRSALYGTHRLTAASHFITRENINNLFLQYNFEGQIGLLSIDIDGNDYWVWEAISAVQPQVVICEYNECLLRGRKICRHSL